MGIADQVPGMRPQSQIVSMSSSHSPLGQSPRSGPTSLAAISIRDQAKKADAAARAKTGPKGRGQGGTAGSKEGEKIRELRVEL